MPSPTQDVNVAFLTAKCSDEMKAELRKIGLKNERSEAELIRKGVQLLLMQEREPKKIKDYGGRP